MMTESEEIPIAAELDFKSTFGAFDIPTMPEIIQAFENQFDDETIMCRQVGESYQGVFKVEANNINPLIGQELTIREIKTKMTARYKTSPRFRNNKKGIFVTIYDAFLGEARNITPEAFAEVMEKHGNMEKPVTPQFYKGQRMLNGNRYMVYEEGTDASKIPSTINVCNRRFRLMFDGMIRYCHMCKAEHGRLCPAREKFKDMVKKRDKKVIAVKVYGDSTVRMLQQMAWTADVAATSGASLVQLIKAADQDPCQKPEVVIVGGTNDIKEEEACEEFVYRVEETVRKMEMLGERKERVTVVLREAKEEAPDVELRRAYLNEKLAKVEQIQVMLCDMEVDRTNHPTIEGSKKMTEEMAEKVKIEFIEKDLMVGSWYRGVQSLFRMGCGGCDDRIYRTDLCGQCKGRSKSETMAGLMEKFEEFTKKYVEKQNPPVVGIGEKRERENETSSDDDIQPSNKREIRDDVPSSEVKGATDTDNNNDGNAPMVN